MTIQRVKLILTGFKESVKDKTICFFFPDTKFQVCYTESLIGQLAKSKFCGTIFLLKLDFIGSLF